MAISSIVAIVVTIRISPERILARSGSVSVVGKQRFRPRVTVATVELICQRVVRTRGSIAALVVPAVVSRIMILPVIASGCPESGFVRNFTC